jgi:hypothetical protein
MLYFPHSTNWGAVASFNRAYVGGGEEYAAILEDDNWWDPDFLLFAHATLREQPEAALCWANLRIWDEQGDGSWHDTGQCVWAQQGPGTLEFSWPQPLQAFDALHSQGAMVFRPHRFAINCVPRETPLAIIEPLRERAARGPMRFIPMPLGHFARTRETARPHDAGSWLAARAGLVRTFLDRVNVDTSIVRAWWEDRRNAFPRDTHFLFVAGLAAHGQLLRGASVKDWRDFALSAARHPRSTYRGFGSLPAPVVAWLREFTPRGEISALSDPRVLNKSQPWVGPAHSPSRSDRA